MMKALTYIGPGQKEFVEKPKPTVELPTDAVVRITKTTICGTDLHILRGNVPAVESGRVLGHEGVIEEVGVGVETFKKGDKVIISCITSCGKCANCKKGLYAHCEDGGWILGHLIDGTQAEYVRIPHADHSLHHIPDGADEEALVMLSDILPTGFEIGVLYGKVQPGQSVAIIGAGPVGLAALLTAQFYSPSQIIIVDLDDNRLEASKKYGATHVVNSSDGKAVEKIMEITNGEGVDVAMEVVGIPETFEMCQKIIKPSGSIPVLGVHGKPVDFHLQDLWIKNIRLTTGLVNTNTTPMLLKTVESNKLQPEQLITHRFDFDDMLEAYDVFENSADNKALKIILSND